MHQSRLEIVGVNGAKKRPSWAKLINDSLDLLSTNIISLVVDD